MIEIKNISKRFDNILAIDNLSCNIEKGSVFGLIGSNGSGKSTLLRIITGIYEPNFGQILIDGVDPSKDESIKKSFFFISDYPYFFNDSTLINMSALYKKIYTNWNEEKFLKLISLFNFNQKQKIVNMSKGMQRQAALILALSTMPKYLFLDEIFDGLDPVIRQLLKKLLIKEITENNLTVVIASHNLRELEDFCDHIGLLHNGKILLDKDIDQAKLGICKIQVAFNEVPNLNIFNSLKIIKLTQSSKLLNITFKNTNDEVNAVISQYNPIFLEFLPLSLEELFINEMEVVGYDIKNIDI